MKKCLLKIFLLVRGTIRRLYIYLIQYLFRKIYNRTSDDVLQKYRYKPNEMLIEILCRIVKTLRTCIEKNKL